MFKLFPILVLVLLLVSPAQAQRLIEGTPGDDNLVKHAISGEATISQRYDLAGTGATGPNGETLRGDDPDDPIYDFWRAYWTGPFRDGTTTMVGGAGADEFLIRTYISGKPAVVLRHVNDDGTINWNGVAGENDFVHDHWVEYFGPVVIADYDADEGDTIRVQGHTVALKSLIVTEKGTLITVQSQQGNGGGAHDEDGLGTIMVEGVTLTEDDVEFTQTNDGIVETWDEFEYIWKYNEYVVNWVRRQGVRRPAMDRPRR